MSMTKPKNMISKSKCVLSMLVFTGLISVSRGQLASEWTRDTKSMDCWDCFAAQGRMCHGKDYKGIPQYTRSSISGKGICCKQDSTDPLCDNSLLDCSMDSFGDSEGKYSDVLTGGDRNNQMFAYCPLLPFAECGLTKSNDDDVVFSNILSASGADQTVSTTMQRIDGSSEVRRFDACYYIIKKDESIDNIKNINFKLTKKGAGLFGDDQMNVYIYEGLSRESATKSLV